jgi:mRNA-degrading endonuclease RelE of RelBE toxin-antitoxin system
MASVLITPHAQKEFEALPVTIRARMAKVFERLEQWPKVSGARPLRGELAGQYRIRTGDYRVQFTAANDQVTVERVGHRDGFYDD